MENDTWQKRIEYVAHVTQYLLSLHVSEGLKLLGLGCAILNHMKPRRILRDV